MKLKQYLFLGVTAVIFAACSNEDYENTQSKNVNFVSSVLSRVTLDGAEWIVGDEVGISIHSSGALVSDSYNIKYLANNAGQTTGFSVAENYTALTSDGSASQDYVAYYPYQASLSDFNYSVSLASQTSGIQNYDLMVAATSSSSTTVGLTFKHKLSKLSFYFVDENSTAVSVSDVAICGMNTTASYNIYTNTLSGESSTANIVPAEVTATDGSIAYHAILLPVDFASSTSHCVSFKVGSDIYAWDMTNQTGSTVYTNFISGGAYAFKITVSNSGNAVTGTPVAVSNTIEGWNDQTGNGSGGETTDSPYPNTYTVISVDGTEITSIATAIASITTETEVAIILPDNYSETVRNVEMPNGVDLWIGYTGNGAQPSLTSEGYGFYFNGGNFGNISFYNINIAGGYVANNKDGDTVSGTVEKISFDKCTLSLSSGVLRTQATGVVLAAAAYKDCVIAAGDYGLLSINVAAAATLVVDNCIVTGYATDKGRLINSSNDGVVNGTFTNSTFSAIARLVNGGSNAADFSKCVFDQIAAKAAGTHTYDACYYTTGSTYIGTGWVEAGAAADVFVNYNADLNIKSTAVCYGIAGATL